MNTDRITQATQEVRLATTMTGGVSLAIWMGGVARELNLLVQASRARGLMSDSEPLPDIPADNHTAAVRGLYLRLLDLLDLKIEVDVLSGTSAGGINAALLGYCGVTGKDLGGLRELWLEVGALLNLLREPTDKVMPSLLQGDGVMLKELGQQIPRLADGPAGSAAADEELTTLFVTTTLLSGEISRFSDSYGTVVQDVDYHGLFRFTEAQLRDPATAGALALAARSSASFPGAFEPSFVPCGSAITDAMGRPDMAPFSELTRPHWAADGGVLDNQPIGPLLQTVFDRVADRQVRRVLLYVVPTSGAPDALATPEPGAPLASDDFAAPLGLLGGLLRDVTAVRNQSIAADLETITVHNDRVSARSDARLRLAQLAGRLGIGERLLTEDLLGDYARRQADAVAQPLVAAIMRVLDTWSVAGKPPIPPTWGAALLPGSTVEPACREAVCTALTGPWSALPSDCASLAAFGRPGYDGGKTVALSIVRAAFANATTRRTRVDLARLGAQVHDSFTVPARFELRQEVDDWLRACASTPVLPDVATELAQRYLRGLTRPAAADIPDAATATQLVASAWRALATVLIGGRAMLRALATPSDPLDVYLDYVGDSVDPDEVAVRLFDLYATQRAMLPVDADVEQPVELVQVSADTRTSLDPSRNRAARKLTGLQMHHFGAFYKSSWRANDWMWGRLDGAGWLVHLLLDPRRIRQLAVEANPSGTRAQWFLDQLAGTGLGTPPAGGKDAIDVTGPSDPQPVMITQQALLAELSCLEDGHILAPSLPLTALWVARALQLHIAADELPVLADTVVHPHNAGSASASIPEYVSPSEKAWAGQVAAAGPALAAQAQTLLRSCPVTDQTLKSELGSPLMVRTIARAAAVASGALESVEQLPGVIRPAVSWARTTTLAGYRLTGPLKSTPRGLIIGGFVALLVGLALAIQQSTIVGVTGLAALSVGAYLIVFGAWQASLRALIGVLSTTVVLALVAVTLPFVRRGLFGTSASDVGVVGRQVHWIGDAWWHPLAVLGVLALLVTLVGLAFGRARRPH